MGSWVCGWVDFGMGYGGFMVVEVLWGFFFFCMMVVVMGMSGREEKEMEKKNKR